MRDYFRILLGLLIISINTCFMYTFANDQLDLINHPDILYQAKNTDDPLLQQKITVNRRFNTIQDLITSLNTFPGIVTFISNPSDITPIPVNVQLDNGTIFDLLNLTCSKLGYTFSLKNDVLVFSALKPIYTFESAPNNKQHMAVTAKKMLWQLTPQDRTLRTALNKWCNTAHWQLVWNVDADYPIITTWNITGSFETAINQVLQASQSTNVPLVAIMHDKNRVLEISSSNEK